MLNIYVLIILEGPVQDGVLGYYHLLILFKNRSVKMIIFWLLQQDVI